MNLQASLKQEGFREDVRCNLQRNPVPNQRSIANFFLNRGLIHEADLEKWSFRTTTPQCRLSAGIRLPLRASGKWTVTVGSLLLATGRVSLVALRYALHGVFLAGNRAQHKTISTILQESKDRPSLL